MRRDAGLQLGSLPVRADRTLPMVESVIPRAIGESKPGTSKQGRNPAHAQGTQAYSWEVRSGKPACAGGPHQNRSGNLRTKFQFSIINYQLSIINYHFASPVI